MQADRKQKPRSPLAGKVSEAKAERKRHMAESRVSLHEQLTLSEQINLCKVCGEPSGSISAGTGFPMRWDKKEKCWLHPKCKPLASVDLMLSYL